MLILDNFDGCPFNIYSVYILKCKDGSLYTGISKNVETRIKLHNDGKGAKYTKSRRPVALKHLESGFSHGDAIKREVEIKRMSKSQKVKLINEGRCQIKFDQCCYQI